MFFEGKDYGFAQWDSIWAFQNKQYNWWITEVLSSRLKQTSENKEKALLLLSGKESNEKEYFKKKKKALNLSLTVYPT